MSDNKSDIVVFSFVRSSKIPKIVLYFSYKDFIFSEISSLYSFEEFNLFNFLSIVKDKDDTYLSIDLSFCLEICLNVVNLVLMFLELDCIAAFICDSKKLIDILNLWCFVHSWGMIIIT